jgi:hypothetical protein
MEVKVFIHNFWEAFGVKCATGLIVHCICMFIDNEHTNTMNNQFQYTINTVAHFTPNASQKL